MSSSNTSEEEGIMGHGPVAILWDIENCPVPSGVLPEDVAGNIRMALGRAHIVTMFSAYGDFNAFPRRLREGCQRTGVKLVDVPNGRKDAADKAILVDMFLFALDNPPPSSIMLISGDVDFAPALHILGQRGYNVVLVIPSGTPVSSALSNAGRFVWDWPSVVRGSKPNVPGPAKSPKKDDAPKSPYNNNNTREVSIVSEYSISTSSRSNENDLTWVQPGDVKGLKGQLVKLLESFCGNLPLTRLPAEYQKMYGRPLYVSEYGAVKLVNLLKKMVGAISVEGKGQNKIVCIKPTVILANKGKKEDDERLDKFRYELQDILVSYSCRIFLNCFEAIYHQRYKRLLDYPSFGVNNLQDLLEKVTDVVVVEQEPSSKRKFMVASA